MAGTLEALEYSRSVQQAGQAGREPSVAGYETRAARQGPEQSRQQTPRDVDWAVETIREHLRGAVSHDDLLAAENAFYRLTPVDTNAAITRLEIPELAHWANELNDFGLLGGYSADERARQFGRFAERLDAEHLTKFAEALGADGAGSTLLSEFGDAIGKYASPETRAEFINNNKLKMTSSTRSGVPFENGWTALASDALYGDGPGGFLRGDVLIQTMDSLSSPQTTMLLRNGVRDYPSAEQRAFQVGTEMDRTAQSLSGVIEEIARAGDPALKLQTFLAASSVLDGFNTVTGRIQNMLGQDGTDPLVRSVSASMASLANGQTNEFVDRLLSTDNDQNGRALTHYIEGLVESGQTETIAWHISQLGRGNAQGEDPMARFTADVAIPDQGTAHANAERLGYFMGSVQAAFLNMADDRKGVNGALADLAKKVLPSGQEQLGTIVDELGTGDRARLTQVLNTLVDGARPDAVVGRSEFITARNAVLTQRGQ